MFIALDVQRPNILSSHNQISSRPNAFRWWPKYYYYRSNSFTLISDAQTKWTRIFRFPSIPLVFSTSLCLLDSSSVTTICPCLLSEPEYRPSYSNDRLCAVLYYGANVKLLQVYYLNYIRLGYIRSDITFGPVRNLRNSSFKAQSTLACSIYFPKANLSLGWWPTFSHGQNEKVIYDAGELERTGRISDASWGIENFIPYNWHAERRGRFFPIQTSFMHSYGTRKRHLHTLTTRAHWHHACLSIPYDAYKFIYRPYMICLHTIFIEHLQMEWST